MALHRYQPPARGYTGPGTNSGSFAPTPHSEASGVHLSNLGLYAPEEEDWSERSTENLNLHLVNEIIPIIENLRQKALANPEADPPKGFSKERWPQSLETMRAGLTSYAANYGGEWAGEAWEGPKSAFNELAYAPKEMVAQIARFAAPAIEKLDADLRKLPDEKIAIPPNLDGERRSWHKALVDIVRGLRAGVVLKYGESGGYQQLALEGQMRKGMSLFSIYSGWLKYHENPGPAGLRINFDAD